MKLLTLVFIAALTANAEAQTVADPSKPCFVDSSFTRWIQGVRAEAESSGVTRATWDAAYPQMSYNETIIKLDRVQTTYFTKSFAAYLATRVTAKSIADARAIMAKKESGLTYLARPDVYGVPGSILVAFWGMESNFVDQIAEPSEGFFNVIQAMTTLAYDCRRADMFRANLIDALRLIQRGDFKVNNYYGKWAGEVSPLQFTPSILINNGVRYDLNPNYLPNPIGDQKDMLATAAKTIMNLGWKPGLPAAQEVEIHFPREKGWTAYADADAPIKGPNDTHPIMRRVFPLSHWKELGITARSGSLPADDNLPAALILPLGYRGPAFLAYPNMNALLRWNNSLNNALTAAHFAARIESDEVPPINPRKLAVKYLSPAGIEQVQKWLVLNGFDRELVADGRLGSGTRIAVRKAQLQALQSELPPDGYPSEKFLDFVTSNPNFPAKN